MTHAVFQMSRSFVYTHIATWYIHVSQLGIYMYNNLICKRIFSETRLESNCFCQVGLRVEVMFQKKEVSLFWYFRFSAFTRKVWAYISPPRCTSHIFFSGIFTSVRSFWCFQILLPFFWKTRKNAFYRRLQIFYLLRDTGKPYTATFFDIPTPIFLWHNNFSWSRNQSQKYFHVDVRSVNRQVLMSLKILMAS